MQNRSSIIPSEAPAGRNTMISIAKGIAIILMVIGHAEAPGLLTNVIYTFHMPLFFITAGFFFNTKYLQEPWRFCEKRFKGLYVPMVKWALIFLVLHNVFFHFGILNEQYGNWEGGVTHPYSPHDMVRRAVLIVTSMSGYDEFIAGAFWFFRGLLIASILFLVLFKLLNSKLKLRPVQTAGLIALGTLAFTALRIGCGLKLNYIPNGGMREVWGLFFFAVGYVYRSVEPKLKQSFWLFLLYFGLTLGAGYMHLSGMNNSGTMRDVLTLPLTGSIGFLAVRYVAGMIDRRDNPLRRTLVFIGENTLYIFVFHILSYKLVSLLKIWWDDLDFAQLGCHMVIHEHSHEDWFWVLYSLVGVAVPLLTVIGWRRCGAPLLHPARRLAGRLLRVGLLTGILMTAAQASAADNVPREDLVLLNHVIEDAPKYTALKEAKIDSLKTILRRIPQQDIHRRVRTALDISESYRTFNTDSALAYSSDAAAWVMHFPWSGNHLDKDLEFRCNLALMKALSTAGIFSAATAIYDALKAEPLTPVQKIEFWKGARQMYSYMQAYVDTDSHFYAEYDKMYLAYDDSLLQALPRSDSFYRFIYAERLVRDNKLTQAEPILLQLIKTIPNNVNLFGMAAYQLAEVYKRSNNESLYASFLAKSAISDIKICVREGLSLPTLAQWLYTKGFTNEAFRYINFALSEANAGNARMRAVTIASYMPVIDSAYREKISSSNSKLTISVIVTTIVSILTIVLIFMLIRYIKKSRRINEKLRATSAMQENYIGHFIALCATYARKLDSLTHLVKRKITSGQTEELLKLVKSGRYAESQDDDFYRIFDTAFLDIFPDFIEKINLLLEPNKQFDGASMTPELRIYALVRLGISESTRISQVLHYSVSTIYAYRNRMRNRAISRDTFDADILNIGRHNE